MPELPTSKEILAEQSDIEQLPENPVDVPWPSKDKYLTAQYEILRREAIEGLRYSVRSVADYRRAQPMMDDDFTNIYTQVGLHCRLSSPSSVQALNLLAGLHHGVRPVHHWPSCQSLVLYRTLQVSDSVEAVSSTHPWKDRRPLPKERQLQDDLQDCHCRPAPVQRRPRSGSAGRGPAVGQPRGCRSRPCP